MMIPPTADRNLLFGILAVQMDFVSQEALIKAMNAWVLEKSKPLGELLVDQGDLSADRRTLLEALVEEHLKQHHHDVSQSLAAVSSITSAREALEQIEDQDVKATLTLMAGGQKSRSTQFPKGKAAETLATPMPTMSVNMKSVPGFRYQILRPHAKGGLGEVLVARDQELHREVALKQIQESRADDRDSQARFLMEAEITGGLEHPGIVPVYGLGHYEDGRPYYAMRFIRGDSLQEAIAQYHRKSPNEIEDSPSITPTKPGRSFAERNLEQRSLLGRFIDVCNAIAYAHSRGVLHRDLKPGNIMLGKYGETLVVDWGLAKPLSVKQEDAFEEPQLEPLSGGDSAQTLMGSAVGTPQYMSPEQAAGRLNQLGPASDVYSLGATLYCLLTGQAPFQGRDVGEILRQVQKGEFPPPRQIARRISPALEAICLRAMALRPEDRYRSPRDLAEDIEKFLADEPVSAHQETIGQRAGRWARRHKPWVFAGALLLIFAVLGLTSATVLINAEHQQTQEALLETERSHKATVEALAKAQAAEDARVEAHVEALLRVQADSVPTVLTALEPVRSKALPLLRRRLENKNLPPAQARRVYLVLLPELPELVEELRQELLKADAEEFAMLREGLRDYQAVLREPLWQTLLNEDADESARFRAASALAEFDPQDSRWPPLADRIAGWLVRQNPLVLGTWVEMLEPIRGELLPSLAREFRENTAPEIRSVANNVVGLWAGDQIELLAGLLKDADPAQFAALIPQLRAHKEQAVVNFRATLKETLAPKWPAPPAKWPAPAPRFAEQVERADGLIADTFALVQTLPLDQFQTVTEGLKTAGYRPTRFRPYRHHGDILVGAIWHRDGKPFLLETALTKDALRKQNEVHQKAGFSPVDVAGYLSPEKAVSNSTDESAAERYGAIWGKTERMPGESPLLCGMDYGEFSKTLSQYQRQSNQFGQMTLHVFHAEKDQARYSAVLQIRPEKQTWQSLWGVTEQQFEIRETPTWSQNDVCLTHLAKPPALENPFQKELSEISNNDQGTGLGQSYLRPYEAGMIALGDGRDERAVEQLTQAINTVKLLPQPYYLRSLAYARLGKAEEAKRDYLSAGEAHVRAVPLLTAEQGRSFTYFEAYTFSLVSAHLGEPNVGETQLETFLASHDKQPDALYIAARAYALMSKIIQENPPREDLDEKPQPVKTLSARYANRAVALLDEAFQHGLNDTGGVLLTQPDFEPIRHLPAYQKLMEDQHPMRRFASVWHLGKIASESRRTRTASPQEHLAECRKLWDEGFRPVAISLSTPTISSVGNPLSEKAKNVAISVWHRPLIGEKVRNQHAKQKANAALALWQLEPQQNHWPLIQEALTPQFEAEFMNRTALMNLPPKHLIDQLPQETPPRVKRLILLALGNYESSQLSEAERGALIPDLTAIYRDDPDIGVHSSAEWLLRKWKSESSLETLEKSLMSHRPLAGKNWYINGQGQTLAVVKGPVEFLMGASATDTGHLGDELKHRVRIDRPFAIATTETSVSQFLRYDPDADFVKASSPDPNGPMINVDWFAAVKYCRWLSEQEGIPEEEMCYPPLEEIGPGMTIPANYLQRTGYRLPTESEWEYAARAGEDAKFSYGDDPQLLSDYGWYIINANDRAHRVGLLKPNRLGLFDVMGNAGEWCHDEYLPYRLPPSGFAKADSPPREVNGNRIGRGGSLLSDVVNCRLTRRFSWNSQQHFRDVGFRVVRTLPRTAPK